MMKFGVVAFWVVSLAVLFGAAGQTHAQSLPAAVLEPYQRHVEALDAQDYPTAAREAEAAFEAGEAADIDPATLSILARNIADTSVLNDDMRDARRWYREAAEIAERDELYSQMLETLLVAVEAFVNDEDFAAAYRFARGAAGAFESLEESGQPIEGTEIARGYQANALASRLAFSRASGTSARRHAEAGLQIVEDAQATPGATYADLARISGIMATVEGEPELAWGRFAAAERIRRRLNPESQALRELSAWRSYVSYFVSEERQTEILRDLVARNILEEGDICLDDNCPEQAGRFERCASGDYVAPEPIGERTPPQYPTSAAMVGAGGFVLVDYTVDARGRVTDIEPVAAVPDDIFVRPSTRAMQRWRHTPATCDGVAIDSRTQVVFFNFRMNDAEADDPEAWRLRRS